jgi:hypothetical protein
MTSGSSTERPDPFGPGQRLLCKTCGSEIQILIPSPVRNSKQIFRCCGADMVPHDSATSTMLDISQINP